MRYTNLRRSMLSLSGVFILGVLVILAGCQSTQQATPSSQIGQDSATASIDATMGAPVLGIIIDHQGRVIDVEPGSAAQQGGIKAGDILTEIDATPLAPALTAASREATLVYGKEIQAIRARINDGKLMKLNLKRSGQSIQMSIQPKNVALRGGQPTPTAVPQNQLYM